MKQIKIYFLFALFMIAGSFQLQAKIYNVKDFGAKADGKTIDSPSINQAIENASNEGGGTVYIPSGEYACYSIRLKSHITIFLESGARIVAAFPTKDQGYDVAEPNEFQQISGFRPQPLEKFSYVGHRIGRYYHLRFGTYLR